MAGFRWHPRRRLLEVNGGRRAWKVLKEMKLHQNSQRNREFSAQTFHVAMESDREQRGYNMRLATEQLRAFPQSDSSICIDSSPPSSSSSTIAAGAPRSILSFGSYSTSACVAAGIAERIDGSREASKALKVSVGGGRGRGGAGEATVDRMEGSREARRVARSGVGAAGAPLRGSAMGGGEGRSTAPLGFQATGDVSRW